VFPQSLQANTREYFNSPGSIPTKSFQISRRIKMDGLLSHKEIFILMNSQNVSAQMGHHQVIVEKYTNGDGIHINNNANIKYLLLKILSDQT
jgi:hypothetical protein